MIFAIKPDLSSVTVLTDVRRHYDKLIIELIINYNVTY